MAWHERAAGVCETRAAWQTFNICVNLYISKGAVGPGVFWEEVVSGLYVCGDSALPVVDSGRNLEFRLWSFSLQPARTRHLQDTI